MSLSDPLLQKKSGSSLLSTLNVGSSPKPAPGLLNTAGKRFLSGQTTSSRLQMALDYPIPVSTFLPEL